MIFTISSRWVFITNWILIWKKLHPVVPKTHTIQDQGPWVQGPGSYGLSGSPGPGTQGPRKQSCTYHFFKTRLQITAITITTILPICQFVRKKGCTTLLWWDSKIKRTCWLQPRWLTHYNSFITFWIIHFKIVTRIANDQFSVLHHGAILHHPMLILILGTLDHVSTVKVTTKTQIFTDQKSSSNTAVYSYVLDEIFPFVLDFFFPLMNAQVYFDFFKNFATFLPIVENKEGWKCNLKRALIYLFWKNIPTSAMV